MANCSNSACRRWHVYSDHLFWSPLRLSLCCFKALLSQSLAQFFLFAGFPFYRFLLCKVTHYWNVFREQYLCVRCNWTHLTPCQQSGLVCLGFISPMMSCPLSRLTIKSFNIQQSSPSTTEAYSGTLIIRYKNMNFYHNLNIRCLRAFALCVFEPTGAYMHGGLICIAFCLSV